MVRDLLWPRLDRHRAADGQADEPGFGRENTGVVYGWIGASHQLGASLAAFGAGAIRTVAGGYQLAFLDRRRPVCAGRHRISDDRRRSFTVQPA